MNILNIIQEQCLIRFTGHLYIKNSQHGDLIGVFSFKHGDIVNLKSYSRQNSFDVKDVVLIQVLDFISYLWSYDSYSYDLEPEAILDNECQMFLTFNELKKKIQERLEPYLSKFQKPPGHLLLFVQPRNLGFNSDLIAADLPDFEEFQLLSYIVDFPQIHELYSRLYQFLGWEEGRITERLGYLRLKGWIWVMEK